VTGVAQLGNILYVVCRKTPVIKMYTADKLTAFGDIHVDGMKNPSDIVACSRDNQLYVADKDYCVWRVSADHSYVKWLPTQSRKDTFHVCRLSLASQRLLMSSPESRQLMQYSTTDKRLLAVVALQSLPDHASLHHAAQMKGGTRFVVCYGTSRDDQQWENAVSELFRLCYASNTVLCR